MKAKRATKRFPVKFPNDPIREDLEFASKLMRLTYDEMPLSEVQALIREIVYRYGWSVPQYPRSTKTVFWALITGDYWGKFRRALREGKTFDNVTSDVVEFQM